MLELPSNNPHNDPQPTNPEITKLINFLRDWGSYYGDDTDFHHAASLLERTRHQSYSVVKATDEVLKNSGIFKNGEPGSIEVLGFSPVVPISIKERLPKITDCDSEGRCWLTDSMTNASSGPGWILDNPEQCTNWDYWLPAYAILAP